MDEMTLASSDVIVSSGTLMNVTVGSGCRQADFNPTQIITGFDYNGDGNSDTVNDVCRILFGVTDIACLPKCCTHAP